MKKSIQILGVAVMLMLAACAPSTVITGSWKSPKADEKKGTYKHLMAIAIGSDIGLRTQMETAITQRAAARGMATTRAVDVFPPNFTKKDATEEQIMQIIRNTGSDVILTVAVKSQKTETRYVPGSSTVYAPYPRYGYYGGFYGYYGTMNDPGYYTTDEITFLETNLYDAATGELLWSAQSKTTNASDFNSFSKEYLYAIIDRMNKDGITQTPINPKK